MDKYLLRKGKTLGRGKGKGRHLDAGVEVVGRGRALMSVCGGRKMFGDHLGGCMGLN